jgi:hypothetical protein
MGRVTEEQRPRRPIYAADVERLAAHAAGGDPYARVELAHATAAALVRAGRGGSDAPTDRLVRLAETVGLDTLSELWRSAEPDTLPGALWTLYLLRTWCERQGEGVARMFRAGRALAPVDEVVAGVAADADPPAVQRLADAVLAGAYDGDFAVALERAAAFFRVVAAGRGQLAGDDADGAAQIRLAGRNLDCAQSLHRAAVAWRAGTLR